MKPTGLIRYLYPEKELPLKALVIIVIGIAWIFFIHVTDVETDDLSEGALIRYVDGSIVDTYDMINDSANYTVLFTPYNESSGWLSNGAGSITKVNNTWYIVHRLRTGDTERGHFLLLNSSPDLTTWPSVWNVSKDDVAPGEPVSFERSSLRHYNNSFYLYFCTDSGKMWSSYYIKSDTAEGLEFSIKNSDNWTVIVLGGKDPEVLHHNGTYYFIVSDGMYKADNPEFSNKTFVADFSQMYIDTYGGGDNVPGCNTGTIMFDNISGNFIYWRYAKDDLDNDSKVNDILWYFAISRDMEIWDVVDRHVKIKNYTGLPGSGTARYPAYFVTENEIVCIMEWEGELGSGNRSIVLWEYPVKGEGLMWDSIEWKDTDGDGHGDPQDQFPNDRAEWRDSDDDGHGDNSDAFPNDPLEWVDTDGDGYGNNGDAFPEDPLEWVDTDGDGHGDNIDAFPEDLTEWLDTDGDTHGDNIDTFPNDPTEWLDTDEDGIGDNGDIFPYDPLEWLDTDLDGVGDNGDVFPDDPNEWVDTDLDGVGDNGDAFPLDVAASVDGDRDGYPDEWNEGMTRADSSTGLRLDRYPENSNKWRDEPESPSVGLLGVILAMAFVAVVVGRAR